MGESGNGAARFLLYFFVVVSALVIGSRGTEGFVVVLFFVVIKSAALVVVLGVIKINGGVVEGVETVVVDISASAFLFFSFNISSRSQLILENLSLPVLLNFGTSIVLVEKDDSELVSESISKKSIALIN